jgi:type VI secretion system protein ImpJ
VKPLQRIVWSEGMLMSPQHFQQQDLYHEALLDERIASVTPYGWGAATLELEARSLDAGQVSLRGFTGVLPQGTVVHFVASDTEVPPTRAIEGHFPAHKQILEVFLALPHERIGTASFAQSEISRGRARYVVDTRNVLDAVSPSDELTLEFARRNFVLLFGDEPREDYEALKIAEVTRDAAGRFAYSETYIPPSLRVGASSPLRDGISRVLALAVARRRAVAEERRHRDASAVEYAADDVTRYLALHALSGAIPVLKHVVESGEGSPHQAYLALVQLAGQLTAFGVDDDPAQLPSYVHSDLRLTFGPLFERLGVLLRAAVANRVISVPFEARADGMHLARLTQEKLFQSGVRFLLSVQAAVPEQQVNELVPRVGKLASWGDIPRLVNAATSGVPLLPTPRPPREVPIRPGRMYFTLSPDHPVWRGVVQERAIAMHLPPPFDPKSTQIELLAIPAE